MQMIDYARLPAAVRQKRTPFSSERPHSTASEIEHTGWPILTLVTLTCNNILITINRPLPEWNVTPPSSSIERLVIRANMERSNRRDLRIKNTRIMTKISPTIATGTAHTTAFRPFFLPVCLPGVGGNGGSEVGTKVRETNKAKHVKIFVALNLGTRSWLMIQSYGISRGISLPEFWIASEESTSFWSLWQLARSKVYFWVKTELWELKNTIQRLWPELKPRLLLTKTEPLAIETACRLLHRISKKSPKQ